MASGEIYKQIAEQLTSQSTDFQKIATAMEIPLETAFVIIALFLIVILIWTLIWKGLALWKSARKGHKFWFVILLVVNTLGILEILYIYVFSKMEIGKATRAEKTKPLKKKR